MDDILAKRPYIIFVAGSAAPYFRAVVPKSLRPFANGRTVYKRSLGLDRKKVDSHYAECLSEWTQLRDAWEAEAKAYEAYIAPRAPVRVLTHLSSDDWEELDWFAINWCDEAVDDFESTGDDYESDDAAESAKRTLCARRDLLKKSYRTGKPPAEWIEELDEHLQNISRIRLHDECPDRRSFQMRVLVEEVKALDEAIGRLNGDVFTPRTSGSRLTAQAEQAHLREQAEYPVSPGVPLPLPSKDGGQMSLQEMFDDWASTGEKKQKSVKEFAKVFEDFTDFIGGGARATELTFSHVDGRGRVIAWLEHCAKAKAITRATLKKRKQVVSAVFGLAVQRDNIAVNPAYNIDISILKLAGTAAQASARSKTKILPFTEAEVRSYFSHIRALRNSADLRPAVSYWFPLFLFAFGMRPEELATLMRDDIEQIAGRYWIRIYSEKLSPNGPKRKPKTDASYRQLPIPDEFSKLGFEDYLASVPRGQWLLPCVGEKLSNKASAEEGRSALTLKYLGIYKERIVKITDEKKKTYSFRHFFQDELNRRGVAREIANQFTGHANSNASDKTYGSTWYPEEPLLEAWEKLRHLNLLPTCFPTWAEFEKS
ncbi:site-specific integrase [Robbsia andropogonis]|uniref:hypothetical protein n=1 Tax=Robbsia andropogonis TaxID=28092 RepID=UPI002A69C196|nr:hypothetical protein [Robbsia andropogonis]